MNFFKRLFSTNRSAIPKPIDNQPSSSNIDKTEKIEMMECPPFLGKAFCSDNECPCDNTTMPPAQGLLWIKPEIAKTRLNCLSMGSLQNDLASAGVSITNTEKIRSLYLPITVCKESAKRRNLDLKIAESDYNLWVKTGKVPCRPTPIIGQVAKPSHQISKLTIEWAEIPSGTFTMGSPKNEIGRQDNETQHKVQLHAFKMSKYPITVGQFKAFVDDTNYKTDAEKNIGGFLGSWIITGGLGYKAGVNWKCDELGNLRPTTEFNHPVIHISWNDAKNFADWMDCRLPTEAEWEYACRAGTTTPFNTGENLTSSQANYFGFDPYNNNPKGEFRRKTLPVGSFNPNAWGLYDMHGNVWEWCNDWDGNYPSSAQINPKGPSFGSARIIRGGNWVSPANNCRSAERRNSPSILRTAGTGFRLVSIK
jgi:formylglycine-generating enzyme required for sulfatase activity